MMDIPTPGPAQTFFLETLGEWTGEETLFPSPWEAEGGVAASELVRALTINGFGVVEVYRQKREDGRLFEGHAVLMFDDKTNEYVMNWFDFTGRFEFRGALTGHSLMMTHTMPEGTMRATYDFNGVPHAFGFAMDMSNDGVSWQPLMRTVYTRVKQPVEA